MKGECTVAGSGKLLLAFKKIEFKNELGFRLFWAV